MNVPTKSLAAATALAFLLSTGIAFAEGPGPSGQMPPAGGDHRGPGMMGSTSGQGPRMGSTTGMMPHGVPGLVTSVGTNSFTMDTRGIDKEGTTTFTVTVSNTTTYAKGPMGIGEGNKTGWTNQAGGEMRGQGEGSSSDHMMRGRPEGAGDSASGTPTQRPERPNFFQQIKSFFNFFGSKNKGDQGAAVDSAMGMQGQGTGQMMGTPATFADVVVGAHVEVIGKVATSTKTIAAERVIIAGARPVKTDDGQLPAGATGTQQTGGQSGGPAAAGSVWDFLFGWLH